MVGIPCGSAACSLGVMTWAGLVLEGDCGTIWQPSVFQLGNMGSGCPGHPTFCRPHRQLLLPQGELGGSSGGISSLCCNTHYQPSSLGAGAESPAICIPIQPLSQLDPPSSAKRPGLLIPRRRWCWCHQKLWEMGKAEPFSIPSSLTPQIPFSISSPQRFPWNLARSCKHTPFSFLQSLQPLFVPRITTHWLSPRSHTPFPPNLCLLCFILVLTSNYIFLIPWRAVAGLGKIRYLHCLRRNAPQILYSSWFATQPKPRV